MSFIKNHVIAIFPNSEEHQKLLKVVQEFLENPLADQT